MIELQVLNKIISTKDYKQMLKYSISPEYFPVYAPEWEYIETHYNKYKSVPDKETIIQAFPDFEFLEVTETWEYLIDKLQEELTYRELAGTINNLQKYVGDSNEAVDYLKSELKRIDGLHVKKSYGTDILSVEEIQHRFEYLKNKSLKLTGEIPIGLKALEEALGGWNNLGDFIILVGRTNEGKTWLLLFLLAVAWQAGFSVLMYSGEMPKEIIGYRVDTLLKHFSNEALTKGHDSVISSYEEYLKEVEDKEETADLLEMPSAKFIVVTPKDIGTLDVPTLENLIITLCPDIVGIDQISIMKDARHSKGDSDPIRLRNISEDLYKLSEVTGVPIITPAQSKRKLKPLDADEVDEEAPDLDSIYGGDGPAQNATRIIALKQLEGGMVKLAVRKNRYGKRGQQFIYPWDIDYGRITDDALAVEQSRNRRNPAPSDSQESAEPETEAF